MRRAELLACVAALALAGCMKIYPDPELPDLKVEWYADDCNPGDIVAISVVGIDDATFRRDIDVPCEAMTHTIADVARERFRIEGELFDSTGQVTSNTSTEVDLRHGLDDTAWLYFGVTGLANFRVGWTFDMGASCASLGAETVFIMFAEPGQPDAFGYGVDCQPGTYRGYAQDGVYTVRAFANAHGFRVAVSPPTPEITISFDELTNIGTLVMSPCTDPCE